MKLIATSLSIGMLLLTQTQEPKQERKVIHLTEVPCKTFIEEMKNEQGIIVAWLQGYYLPEDEPPMIDVDKLLSELRMRVSTVCIWVPLCRLAMLRGLLAAEGARSAVVM